MSRLHGAGFVVLIEGRFPGEKNTLAMAQQLRAEEIEQFLGTVDGVASARLLTSAAGDIDQIYVTADRGIESRAARRAVVAALITRFGIPLEPWRVQVAALKQFAPAELPRLRVLRVEETISGTETVARVQVGWERAGELRTGTGQSRGPIGASHRLRTLAAAAVEAARTVVDPTHRRIALQHVSMTTCMDRPVVVAGITVGTAGGQDAFVGAAFERDGPSGAAVAAALDAVTKCLLHAAFETPRPEQHDRRAHLEAMRRYARAGRTAWTDAVEMSARPPAGAAGHPRGAGAAAVETEAGEPSSPRPVPASSGAPAGAPPSTSPLSASAAAGAGGASSLPVEINGEHHPARCGSTAGSAAPAQARVPAGGGVATAVHPDILRDLREIRPEEKGETTVGTHDNARVNVANRSGRQAIEDEYFATLIERRTPVHVRCRDGYELAHAVIREVGTYALVVEADGTTELLYKHAIISVRPAGARG